MHLSLKEILIDSMRVELEVACVDNNCNCQKKFSKQYKTKIDYTKSFFLLRHEGFLWGDFEFLKGKLRIFF